MDKTLSYIYYELLTHLQITVYITVHELQKDLTVSFNVTFYPTISSFKNVKD